MEVITWDSVIYLAVAVTCPSERENGVITCSSTASVLWIM